MRSSSMGRDVQSLTLPSRIHMRAFVWVKTNVPVGEERPGVAQYFPLSQAVGLAEPSGQ